MWGETENMCLLDGVVSYGLKSCVMFLGLQSLGNTRTYG